MRKYLFGGDDKEVEASIDDVPFDVKERVQELKELAELENAEADYANSVTKRKNAEARLAVSNRKHEALYGKESVDTPKKKGWSLKNYKAKDLAIVAVILIVILVALATRC